MNSNILHPYMAYIEYLGGSFLRPLNYKDQPMKRYDDGATIANIFLDNSVTYNNLPTDKQTSCLDLLTDVLAFSLDSSTQMELEQCLMHDNASELLLLELNGLGGLDALFVTSATQTIINDLVARNMAYDSSGGFIRDKLTRHPWPHMDEYFKTVADIILDTTTIKHDLDKHFS